VNRRSTKGFTLIELMVSMVLGLVVVGGVVSVMLANKRSYRTNEGLAQIQESARTAFELMARDIRQAGGNGCDNNNRVGNLIAAGGEWWSTWYGVTGFDGAATDTAVADGTTLETRVAGTDSIHVQSVQGTALPVSAANAASTTLRFAAATPFVVGDILLACDIDHSVMFQATAYDAATFTVTHAASGANCASGLGFPTVCDSGVGNLYAFPINSQVARVTASAWYIGNNDRPDEGGRSLYRVRLDSGGVEVTEEIVAGVTDMQLQYGLNGSEDILEADDAAMNWALVNSIFITLTMDSADTNVTTDKAVNTGRIQRTFTYLITLRNRVP
jgi:type IV pilus assembly protein PilW